MGQYIVTVIVAVFTSVFASTGFWSWLTAKNSGKTAEKQLLVGLAHDRIIAQCEMFIARGYITKDEYENLHDYLYVPYIAAGGNGTAKKLMGDVDKLPVRTN